VDFYELIVDFSERVATANLAGGELNAPPLFYAE
jgi:hypothetical protein